MTTANARPSVRPDLGSTSRVESHDAPPPFPTDAALALERASWADLERTFVRGVTPDLDSLVGWEFRGINRLPFNGLPVAKLIGIKKFLKGFCRAPTTAGDELAPGAASRVMGYNSPVAQNVLDGRWHIEATRFGFYEVKSIDATARDNTYLHALLLDYGLGGNKVYDPSAYLRDYIVQVDAANPDLLLGKAYYAIGPARLGTLNYFILERHRTGLTDYVRR